jgi:outer membrane lipoprotein carrier protein
MQENRHRQRQIASQSCVAAGCRPTSFCSPPLIIRLIVFAVLSVLGLACSAFADPLDEIKQTYSQIKAVEARFQQKLFIMTMKKEREFTGEFLYKRSKGFLWKYNSPKQRVFLYDGKAVWQAEEDKDFVIKEKLNKQKMEGNFLDLVEDISKIDQFFALKGTATEGATQILSLTPKKEGTLRSARIWTDNAHLVTKIELVEVTGNTNVITFSSVKMNASLNDSLFVFKPGKKEVVEQ